MTNNISPDAIKKLLEGIKHPAIDETLLNLGIIKDIKVEGNKAIIVVAFPFENIPIKEQLIELVKEPLAELKLNIEIKITVMEEKELQNFLAREQKHWKNYP